MIRRYSQGPVVAAGQNDNRRGVSANAPRPVTRRTPRCHEAVTTPGTCRSCGMPPPEPIPSIPAEETRPTTGHLPAGGHSLTHAEARGPHGHLRYAEVLTRGKDIVGGRSQRISRASHGIAGAAPIHTGPVIPKEVRHTLITRGSRAARYSAEREMRRGGPATGIAGAQGPPGPAARGRLNGIKAVSTLGPPPPASTAPQFARAPHTIPQNARRRRNLATPRSPIGRASSKMCARTDRTGGPVGEGGRPRRHSGPATRWSASGTTSTQISLAARTNPKASHPDNADNPDAPREMREMPPRILLRPELPRLRPPPPPPRARRASPACSSRRGRSSQDVKSQKHQIKAD